MIGATANAHIAVAVRPKDDAVGAVHTDVAAGQAGKQGRHLPVFND